MLKWILAVTLAACAFAVEPKPYFTEPALSPDGSEIAFVSGGDIWTVPARGGEARLLVSNPASESAPRYSPDGRYLAFTSTRTGSGDVYLLTLASGELKRLTFDDSNEQTDGWSPDSKWVYFSSSARNIAGMEDIYRVSISGGTPAVVSTDRYLTQYFAAPAPDGHTLAFTARGNAGSQWWRKGHSHLDESEIWLRRESSQQASPAAYQRITEGGAKEVWPMWARDGRSLFYMSDRSGAQNIWRKPLDGAARQITRFSDGRVIWPSISNDGRAIVFERDFRVWKLDTESGKAAPVEIARRGVAAGPAVQHVSLNGQFQELALSPDGKKVAFTSHGEVFAASAKEGGEAARITHTAAPESGLAWAPDSLRLAYVSDREGNARLYLYDFATGAETRLTTAGPDAAPRFSPDGKSIAFLRDGHELRIFDLASKQERTLATGYFDHAPFIEQGPFAWSPDSQWVAFFNEAGKGFTNVYLAPAAGGAVQPVSFLANSNGRAMAWAPDGKYLLFTTNQRTENNQLARVDLTLRTPRFREDQFHDLFKEETPRTSVPSGGSSKTAAATSPAPKPAPQPVKIVFEDIRRRLSFIATGVDTDEAVISPDGKTAVLVASAAGQQNLYSYSLDDLSREPAVARQLTSTPGRKSWVQFTPDGKEVFYLDRGGISSVSLDQRQPKPLAVAAEMDVDFSTEKLAVFEQAWTYIRDNFFDAKYNGVDWNAVHAQYQPLIAGSATPEEMRRLLAMMVGELNASHMGASNPPGGQQSVTGRLGLRFDRGVYESSGKLQITEVIALSPADVAGIKSGETLEAVDGVAMGPAVNLAVNLDEQLDHKIGKRVLLKVSGRDVPVQPISLAAEKNLLYRAWVEQNRAYVSKISNGRLGYVHMQDMSAQALDRLHLDLDAENQSREGVVIDLRNNTGGFVNAYALDVFARRPYLKMTGRGRQETPARTALGQRALEAPTVLVTNQHSLSDAEDFTEGYRALKLGKVVGEPTAGWIIYTSNATLIDGTSFRLPSTRIRDANGADMELHPRPVDIVVSRPVGESETGKDSQLDVAVKTLLNQLVR